MKQKEDLFQLIKSMSRSEKRYFSVEAQRGGTSSKNYLDLFKRINEMEEYNEELLKKRFPKNLAANKAFLYESLLKSMRDYRRIHMHSVRLRELIQDFNILYQRGLNEQAEYRLKEAKSLAHDLGNDMALLEINHQERLLAWYKKADFFKVMETLDSESQLALENINEEQTYLNLNYILLSEHKKGNNLYNASFQEELTARYEPMLLDKKIPNGPRAQHRYYQCLATYYNLKQDHQQTVRYYRKVIECWNRMERFKEEEFFKYLVDVSNLMSVYYNLEAFDKLWELIQEFEEEKPRNAEEAGIIFVKTAIYKILVFINTGKRVDLQALNQTFEKGLQEHKINEGSRMVLIAHLALYCFMCEAFEQCTRWCEEILGTRGKKMLRKDIQIGLCLLRMMSEYEKGDLDTFDNIIRSTGRYLKSFEVYEEHHFEFQLYSFIKKLHNTAINEEKELLRQFKSYLETFIAKESTAAPFDLDELSLVWIKSKLEYQPVLELCKK